MAPQSGFSEHLTLGQLEDVVREVQGERPIKRLLTAVSSAHRRNVVRLWLPQQIGFFLTTLTVCVAELRSASIDSGTLWQWLALGMANWLLRSVLYLVVFRATPATVAKSNWLRCIPIAISLLATAHWVWSVLLFVTPEWTPAVLALHIGFVILSLVAMGIWPTAPIAAGGYVFALWFALSGRAVYVGLLDVWTALALDLSVYAALHIFVYSTVIRTRQELDQCDVANVLRAQATAALEQRSLFFACASHDFRQRLHSVKLRMLSVMMDEPGQERARRALDRLGEEIDDLDDYTQRLLEFAKLESVDEKPTPSNVELQRLFQGLELRFEQTANARGASLDFRHSSIVLRSDALMLQRMLENLVSNALKFTRRRVLVTARRRGPTVLIEVWDQGPGVAPDMRSKIFEAFHQDNRAAAPGNVGIGLGLAIVARFADRLRCTVTLRSEVGRGSVFCLSFPGDETPPARE